MQRVKSYMLMLLQVKIYVIMGAQHVTIMINWASPIDPLHILPLLLFLVSLFVTLLPTSHKSQDLEIVSCNSATYN